MFLFVYIVIHVQVQVHVYIRDWELDVLSSCSAGRESSGLGTCYNCLAPRLLV